MVNEHKKTFVLDTNVLLHDPRALFGFDEHDVVIPMTVIEEIDKFKKNLDEDGRNARAVSRSLLSAAICPSVCVFVVTLSLSNFSALILRPL